MINLKKIFLFRYPSLAKKAHFNEEQGILTIEILFKNPRYSVWLKQENKGCIVGINFLHNHFDLESEEENLENMFSYFEEIVNDKIVAIGNKKNNENYIIATLDRDLGISKYLNMPNIEICSFNENIK
ncbi:MAG: hypothetical protein HY22_08890 [[Candidatus Thermochlorobacteriaceae] bacterium GBChlB]|nr:MAG: hypothetical protein HY22_08890 [[Candidatus Thermochlorobacteriaceae] bacterium GBChlB]